MIKIEGLFKKFDKPVLTDVNFIINKNEITLLTGENGAGKTTLLKTIAGIIAPDKGRITIDGIDSKKADLKHRLGFIFLEDRAYFLRLNGMDNLLFHARIFDMKKQIFRDRLEMLLTATGFRAELLQKPVLKYSAGERRMLGILRTLLHSPTYVFIDEIRPSLDEKHLSNVIRIIESYAEEGNAVFIVSHNADVPMKRAYAWKKLENGKIVDEIL